MNLNPFLAALGGAFRGAAVDQEMQRRLQAADEERQRIARAEARQAVLDQRQLDQDQYARKHSDFMASLAADREGYVPMEAMKSDSIAASLPTGPLGMPDNLARLVELAKTKATGRFRTLPSGDVLGYDPQADPKVQDRQRAESVARISLDREEQKNAAKLKAEDDERDRRFKLVKSYDAKVPDATAAAIASDKNTFDQWFKSKVVPPEPSLSAQIAQQNSAEKRNNALDSAEAWWNTSQGAKANAAAGEAYKAIRASHPDWEPQRIMLAVREAIEGTAKYAKTVGGNSNRRVFKENPPGTSGTPTTAPTAPPAAPSGSAADRWEALRKQYPQAKDDEITAMVKREFNIP